MNIKKCILWLNNSVGISKVEIAKKLDTNVKMVDSILTSNEDTYIFSKAVRNKSMSTGMKDSKGIEL